MDAIRAALRRMLGPDVGIALCDPAAGGQLWPVERSAMARAIPRRRREFAAGRQAARAALAAIGVAPAAIPVGPNRSPVWPTGYIGSIAHCDGCCIALAAPLTRYAALGVDVEPARALDPDLIPVVCTPVEQSWVARTANPGLAALQIFSAKEAVYKAQYPLTQEVIGFDAITLSFAGDSFTSTSSMALPALRGKFLIREGLVLSFAHG